MGKGAFSEPEEAAVRALMDAPSDSVGLAREGIEFSFMS